jgi:hypothetical protein
VAYRLSPERGSQQQSQPSNDNQSLAWMKVCLMMMRVCESSTDLRCRIAASSRISGGGSPTSKLQKAKKPTGCLKPGTMSVQRKAALACMCWLVSFWQVGRLSAHESLTDTRFLPTYPDLQPSKPRHGGSSSLRLP